MVVNTKEICPSLAGDRYQEQMHNREITANSLFSKLYEVVVSVDVMTSVTLDVMTSVTCPVTAHVDQDIP